jgi:hypothetical protein
LKHVSHYLSLGAVFPTFYTDSNTEGLLYNSCREGSKFP